jgi:hypothetical protein
VEAVEVLLQLVQQYRKEYLIVELEDNQLDQLDESQHVERKRDLIPVIGLLKLSPEQFGALP